MTQKLLQYDPRSPIGKAEGLYLAALSRFEAAQQEAAQLASDLHECEQMWSNASLATTTAADFAALTGQRVLLQRAYAAARTRAAQSEAALPALQQAYRQRNRSLLDARDRLDKARYRDDRQTVQAMERHIAHLTLPEDSEIIVEDEDEELCG